MPKSTTLSSTPPTSPLSPEPIILSPSKIGQFVNCGRSYRFQYLDKIPGEQSEAMVKGTVVHRALERFYQEPARELGDLTYHVGCALSELEEEWTPVVAEAANFADDVRILAERIFDVEVPTEVNVLSTELRLSEMVGDYALRGVIDRVDQEPDGSITLVDYKTGKPPAKRDEKDKLRALMLYSRLYEQAFERKVDRVKLIYLKGTAKKGKPIVITAPVTKQGVDFAVVRLTAVGDAITAARDADFFGASVGPLCAYCPYVDRCPEGDSYLTKRGK